MKRIFVLFFVLILVYNFSACSGSDSNSSSNADNENTGNNASGITADFTLVQLSDLHLGKTPDPDQKEENLVHAVEQINQSGADLVILTGDLTDHGYEKEYDTLREALSELSVPYYCIPGDNDIIDGTGDLELYREELGDEYYAFDFNGARFIGLNNNSQLSLNEEQRVWFEEELSENEDKPAIVFAHYPLFDADSEFELYTQAETLIDILESYNVLIYMCGHEHISAEYSLNGIYYIWCDNLSYFHDVETYNLYEISTETVKLYHMHYDGTKEYVTEFSCTQKK